MIPARHSKAHGAARPHPDVAVFASFPDPVRNRLMQVRDLIFDAAAGIDGVGQLQETLRWGEPSYLTAESGGGSTIRLAPDKASGAAALHFICHTKLVEEFRRLYPDTLHFKGERSIILGDDKRIDEPALQHCIGLALTYHLRKKRGRGA